MNDDWNDLDKKIDAWLIHNMWWVIIVLALVLIYLLLSISAPALRDPSRWREGVIWNEANPSVGVIWNYRNPSPVELIQPIWNRINPSPVQCSTYKGPNYRPEGDNDYNPAPDYIPYLPQPYCWTCHSNTYIVFGNASTALAHSGGNPVAVGDM